MVSLKILTLICCSSEVPEEENQAYFTLKLSTLAYTKNNLNVKLSNFDFFIIEF